MFLYQKLKYNYEHITLDNKLETIAQIQKIMALAKSTKVTFTCFDTETTGLNIITDTPFLIAFGFGKTVRTMDFDKRLVEVLWDELSDMDLESNKNYVGLSAHNCKYDWHMCLNGGAKIPDKIKLFDCKTVARLTEYSDEEHVKMSLEALGVKYVDDSSKFAGKIIKDLVSKITSRRKNELREKMMDAFPDQGFFKITKSGDRKGTGKLTSTINDYLKHKVRYINDDTEIAKFIDENFTPATYEDVYKEEPELMRSYAADDIVIMIEYLNKALPVLAELDPGYRVFSRDNDLIKATAQMERIGLKVDKDYILKCRKKVEAYKELLYTELEIYTGKSFTAGQHEYIKNLLKSKYNVLTESTDDKALSYIVANGKGEVVDVVKNIQELRTIDKWSSTYIDGKLNSIIDGRIYTEIDNNGAVTGRVSCNMQQQPKKPLLDRDGNELFHPRQMFVADEGHNLFFIDESQMELRVQAYYTMLHSKEPDKNLCSAYIPYLHKHCITGETFKHYDTEFVWTRWNEQHDGHSAWLDSNGQPWTPTDLHTATTKLAFPTIDPNSPEFSGYRAYGKQANFLKVYQGGVQALVDELGVDRAIAQKLDNAFYAAFPRVKDYQYWVEKSASLYGHVENLYGRRYYMSSSAYYYKLCNYLIQGTCADMVKKFTVEIFKYLAKSNTGVKMVLPVHDEIIFSVPFGMEYIMDDIQKIMEDVSDVIKYIPMIAEVQYSETNWREKRDWNYERYIESLI